MRTIKIELVSLTPLVIMVNGKHKHLGSIDELIQIAHEKHRLEVYKHRKKVIKKILDMNEE